MRLEQLQYLVEISNSKSISIASENLYISQPALSRAVKNLEEELGVTLLFRTVDGVRLTKAGQALLPEMKEIIEKTKQLSKHAINFSATCPEIDYEGPFHIYTLPVLVDSLLLPALDQLQKHYPNIEFYTHLLDMNNPVSLTLPTDADLIFTINMNNLLDQDILDSGLRMEPLFIGNSFLVVSKDHPLASKKIVTRTEVLEQKLISHVNGFDLSILYQALTHDTPNVILKSNSARVIKQLLKGKEAALLTNNLLLQLDYAQDPDLVAIPIKNSRTQYFCLHAEDHPYHCFIEEFIETLKFVRNSL